MAGPLNRMPSRVRCARYSLAVRQFGNACGLFKQTAGVAYIGQLCINYDVLCSAELAELAGVAGVAGRANYLQYKPAFCRSMVKVSHTY